MVFYTESGRSCKNNSNSISSRQELAYTIGIENSIGDSVVLFNPLRDPLEIIGDAININRSGADVVVGVSESVSATVTYKLIRPFINKLLFKIGYEIPRNATGFMFFHEMPLIALLYLMGNGINYFYEFLSLP